MEKAVYFILIFCGILSQGICNMYQENNEDLSDLLIRKKRIVGGIPTPTQTGPYLVSAVLANGNYHCPATLLTADIAISSATCFITQNPHNMMIKSRTTAGEKLHEIVRVIFFDHNFNPIRPTFQNLALVRFSQPIRFQTSLNRPISIYTGNLTTDQSPALVISWVHMEGSRWITTDHLQSFSALVVSFEYCQNVYRNVIHLGNICATGMVPGDNCDNGDTGVPLVINNQLLGIFVYRRPSHSANPNVFMNLLDHGIRRWIHAQVPSLHLI